MEGKAFYVDISIFLNAVLYDITEFEEAKISYEILHRILNSELNASTSYISWDEFIFILEKTLGKEIALDKASNFLQFSNLKFISITEPVIMKAQSLYRKYKLDVRKLIHVACALTNGVPYIISFDEDYSKIDEIKYINPNDSNIFNLIK